MLLLEQNDEWLVGRRYLSETSMALVLAAATDQDRDREEVLGGCPGSRRSCGGGPRLMPAVW